MAAILIRVMNKADILETLLYVFKGQMSLGKQFLMLTIKHIDGSKEYIKGSIGTVFRSELVKDIEVGDIILLEHTNNKIVYENLYLSGQIESLDILVESVSKIKTCSYFLIPKESGIVYFIIKNCPMAKYTIQKNEIISEKMIGTKAEIMNNICGKIDFPRGVFSKLSTFK